MGLVIGLGIFLRLYGISDQLLLNDEWHALNSCLVSSWGYLLTHFHRTASFIPINLYNKLMLESFFWNEPIIRLPCLVAGIFSLIVFPALVGRIFNTRVTGFFRILMAVSSVLIFFSRNGRPYSIYVLFSFLTVFYFYFWLRDGNNKHKVSFVVFAVLSAYFHLFAVVLVGTLLGYGWIVRIAQNTLRSSHTVMAPQSKELLSLSAGMIMLIVLIYLPALINGSLAFFVHDLVGKTYLTLASFAHFLALLSGSAHKPLIGLFLFFLITGQARLLKGEPLLGWLLAMIFAVQALALVNANSIGLEIPLVMARYGLIVFPLSYLLVSIGWDDFLRRLEIAMTGQTRERGWSNLLAVAFFFLIFWSGPWRTLYAGGQNNFTGHSAFHERYGFEGWEKPYVSWKDNVFRMTQQKMPMFYSELSKERAAFSIIEYPMPVGDHFNIYYYYQHFHQKDVVIGYWPDFKQQPVNPDDYIYGHTFVDEILRAGGGRYQAKFKFLHMVNLKDNSTFKRAKYIIVHKNIFREIRLQPVDQYQPAQVPQVMAACLMKYGMPVYQDTWIMVFKNEQG